MILNQSLHLGLALFVALAVQPPRGREPRTLAEVEGPFRLTATPLRVTLAAGSAMREALAQSSEAKLFVELRGLSAADEPGTTFAVYVDLPEGGSREERERHRIGSLNFFGTSIRGAEPGHELPSESRSFDLTPMARGLLARASLGAPITITVEAHSTPAPEADVTIRSIAIVQP